MGSISLSGRTYLRGFPGHAAGGQDRLNRNRSRFAKIFGFQIRRGQSTLPCPRATWRPRQRGSVGCGHEQSHAHRSGLSSIRIRLLSYARNGGRRPDFPLLPPPSLPLEPLTRLQCLRQITTPETPGPSLFLSVKSLTLRRTCAAEISCNSDPASVRFP